MTNAGKLLMTTTKLAKTKEIFHVNIHKMVLLTTKMNWQILTIVVLKAKSLSKSFIFNFFIIILFRKQSVITELVNDVYTQVNTNTKNEPIVWTKIQKIFTGSISSGLIVPIYR